MVEKLRVKPKPKSLHTVDILEESPHIEVGVDSQDRSMDFLYK